MTEEGKVEKQKISDALKAFRGKPLGDAALQLVEALGYHSPYGGRQYGAKEFLDDFLDTTESRTQMRTRFEKRVNKIHAVSQVGQDELNNLIAEKGNKEIKVEDGKTFLFLAIEIKDNLHPTRTEYAETTRLLNRHLPMPLIVIYRAGEEINIAFAQRQERDDKRKRDILGTVSLLRDISCEQPHSGHLSILQDLSLEELREQANDFDTLLKKWLEILSVETLNKKFYQELSEWFNRAAKKAKFPSSKKADEKPEVIQRRHVIRLITRILFIWFIKEKGLVAEELFNEDEIQKLLKKYDPKKGDSYYRAILQNLFFATLNTEIKDRDFSKKNNSVHRNFNLFRYADLMADKDQLKKLFGKTPFVNGGLFDCLDDFEGKKQGGERIDCFTDNPAQRKELGVPNLLFFDKKEGLFSILGKYKFTVEESTPVDQEVALDPELLGRVFENLLATLNPETGEQARKSTGSFYTPRAVVDYMVREALVAYFAGKMSPNENLEKRLRDLLTANIDYENPSSGQLTQGEKKKFIQHTEKLRLLDPAVGSGAFPMGALTQMTMALGRIDPENKNLKEREMKRAEDFEDDKIREEAIKTVEEVFSEENNFNNYGRKLSLIRDCLFGVDIQPEAVQIARLRFFISLTIEQKVNRRKKNFGIEPLPNLETRLLAANTLTKLGGTLRTNEVREMEDELLKIRKAFFSAKTRQKKRKCKEQDEAKRKELAKHLRSTGFPGEDADKISQWDLYDQTTTANWFDSELMFGISDGFDVVIGNPPYVRQEKIENKEYLLRTYDKGTAGRSDFYVYFYIRGMELLKDGGAHVFICSNSWLDVGFGAELQLYLLNNTHIKSITSSETSREFFTASINTVVSVIIKGKGNNAKTLFRSCQRTITEEAAEEKNLSGPELAKGTLPDFRHRWGGLYLRAPKIFDYLMKKHKDKFVRLGGVAEMKRGTTTGSNDFFVLTKEAAAKWKIDDRFLRLVLQNTSDVNSIVIDSADLPKYLLVLSETVENIGDDNLTKYIQYGESRNFHKNASCRDRKPAWYCLPKPSFFHIAMNYMVGDVARFYVSDTLFTAVHNLHLICSESKDSFNIAASANSMVSQLIIGVLGRATHGGGLIKIELYEAVALPIPHPQLLDHNKCRRLLNNMGKGKLDSDDRKELDEYIYDKIGLTQSDRRDVYDATMEMVEKRHKKAQSAREQESQHRLP